ncbi:MAG: hypothetical protein ACTSSH_03965 [Candidatus Heimdallarchaeota archaeon]
MKALFLIGKDVDIKAKLEEVAQKYNSTVTLDDDSVSHYILVKPKLQLKQRIEDEKYTINVWGASEDDIKYLTTIFGEPTEAVAERMTALEFATEVVGIPGIAEKSIEEIIEILELDERKYKQYIRVLNFAIRKTDAPEVVHKALGLLEK